MNRTLRVHLLPGQVDPLELAGGCAAVIDVLRASTTIITALVAGATRVMPCLEVDDARRIAADRPPGETALGGERQGLRIDGFDFGNSPAEYTPDRVGGRSIVFITTNGTRALLHCRHAARVVIAALVNAQAAAEALASHDQVDLVCAGTRGQITSEDALAAGLLVEKIMAIGARYEVNQAATEALAQWRDVAQGAADDDTLRERLIESLRASLGGRNLLDIGLESDVELAAQVDRFDIVPEYDHAAAAIRRP